MLSLSDNNQAGVINAFNSAQKNLDNLLSVLRRRFCLFVLFSFSIISRG